MALRGLLVLLLCLSGCDGTDCADDFCDEGGERDALARGASMTTSRQTKVYESSPIFSTRSNWQLADVIDVLEHGTLITIEATRKVGLPTVSMRTWYQVSYKTRDGEGRSGWVYAGALDPIRTTNINAFVYEAMPVPTVADGYKFAAKIAVLAEGSRVKIEETRKLVVSPTGWAIWHRVSYLAQDGARGGGWMLDYDLE